MSLGPRCETYFNLTPKTRSGLCNCLDGLVHVGQGVARTLVYDLRSSTCHHFDLWYRLSYLSAILKTPNTKYDSPITTKTSIKKTKWCQANGSPVNLPITEDVSKFQQIYDIEPRRHHKRPHRPCSQSPLWLQCLCAFTFSYKQIKARLINVICQPRMILVWYMRCQMHYSPPLYSLPL